jgi:hypothetical protein
MVRDVHADGDAAMIKIDGGINLNNVPGVDHITPGSVQYGFEEFTTVRSPGFVYSGGANVGTGFGTYTQTIDTAQLAEGRHYVTVRAFRHRDAATGGDGGPAVFTDFTKTIYVDRLKPEAAIVSFAPYASSPNTLQNRDLIIRSTDGTADNMHFFLDLPANTTDAQIMQMVNNGQGDAADYDRDSFISGYSNLRTGNHVATVVTFEASGRTNIQRFPGLFTQALGVGFGDISGNGVVAPAELLGPGPGNFEQILYSQNSTFSPAADVDGDGKVTNLDLIGLAPYLVAGNASQQTLTAYDQLLLKRGDVNQDGATNMGDVATLYSSFGTSSWLRDLNVDGTVNLADVDTLVTDLVRTSPGDFNLDRVVDGADLMIWQTSLGMSGARFDLGDADLNGLVNGADLAIWEANFGATGPVLNSVLAAVVPEPSTLSLMCGLAVAAAIGRRRHTCPRRTCLS